MKNVIFLLLICAFYSCSTTSSIMQVDNREQLTQTNTINFNSIPGLLVTDKQHIGEYESIGIVISTTIPKVMRFGHSGKASKHAIESGGFFQKVGNYYYVFSPLDYQKAFDAFAEKAAARGADAVIKFQMEDGMNFKQEKPAYQRNLVMKGIAIKRGETKLSAIELPFHVEYHNVLLQIEQTSKGFASNPSEQ